MSLFRREEARSYASTLGTGGWIGGGAFGKSAKSAQELVPVFSATSLIADQISIMPFSIYDEALGNGAKMAVQPSIAVSPHPNPVFTRVEWVHQYCTSFLMRGNAYGLITEVEKGIPSKVAWLHPDKVTVDESGALPVYLYNGRPLDIATVIHIPWYPQEGSVVGLSPISQFRTVLETGHYAAKFGLDWFKNGTAPSGHLKYAKPTIDTGPAAAAKARFKSAVANNDLFVSGSDWSWESLSVKPEEAQFLQTIKATANQVAAIYHVDPQDIGGESGSSMTYSTVELNQIKMQTRALQPIFTRLEQHLDRLLPAGQYAKFNPDALIRTDLKSRMDASKIGLETGLLTLPEGRALENRAPLTDDEFDAWMRQQGKTVETSAELRAKQKAEIVQKIYLGVGTVLTAKEARVLLEAVGFELDPNASFPPKLAPIQKSGDSNAS